MKLLLRNICITKWRYPVYRVVASLTSGGPAKNGAVPWMDGFSWPRSATLPLHSEGPTSVALTRIRGCAGNSLEMKNAVCVYLPRPDENQRPRYAGGGDRPPRLYTFLSTVDPSIVSLFILRFCNLFSITRLNNN